MSEKNLQSVGARLRHERERLGLSQQTIATKCEVSHRTQGAWEKGEQFPNAEVLGHMAEIGVDVLFVVTGRRSEPIESTLTPQEVTLLDHYRKTAPARQSSLRDVAEALAQAGVSASAQVASPHVVIGGDVHQQIEGGATFSAPVSFSFSSAKKRK